MQYRKWMKFAGIIKYLYILIEYYLILFFVKNIH